MKKEDLTKAFRAARAAALDAAVSTVADRGACNFDAAVLNGRGLRRPDVYAAAEAAGLRIADEERKRDGLRFEIAAPIKSQGFRNTAQARAIRDALTAAGLTAVVHYTMD